MERTTSRVGPIEWRVNTEHGRAGGSRAGVLDRRGGRIERIRVGSRSGHRGDEAVYCLDVVQISFKEVEMVVILSIIDECLMNLQNA